MVTAISNKPKKRKVMKINITNHNMPNSVAFYLPKCFVETLINKNVVIIEVNGEINIREAIIDDKNTIKVKSNNQVTYTTFKDKENIMGEYEFEINNGILILYRE
jgi:hypothetical protein